MKQKTITRKSEVKTILSELEQESQRDFLNLLDRKILFHKVKFPLLEFIADEFCASWEWKDLFQLCDDVAHLNHISSWPLIGKILQNHLPVDMDKSFYLAGNYIIQGDAWHVCDIISERVFGNGILLDFSKTVAVLRKMIIHENQWIRRSPGIAVHLAAKRGVDRAKAKVLMELLLEQKNTTDFQVQKGSGWGIETLAKFHPDLAREYKDVIFDGKTKAWIVKKYKLGLEKRRS